MRSHNVALQGKGISPGKAAARLPRLSISAKPPWRRMLVCGFWRRTAPAVPAQKVPDPDHEIRSPFHCAGAEPGVDQPSQPGRTRNMPLPGDVQMAPASKPARKAAPVKTIQPAESVRASKQAKPARQAKSKAKAKPPNRANARPRPSAPSRRATARRPSRLTSSSVPPKPQSARRRQKHG